MFSKSVYSKQDTNRREDTNHNIKRRNRWTEDSEKLFLQLWRENLDKLRACKKNSHILMEIVVEMELQGYKYNLTEIKTKMHNMTSKYRRECVQVTSTGIQSLWEHYDEMNSLITYFENGLHNSVNNGRTKKKKIIIDDEMSLLMPQKSNISQRDAASPCNDNSFETLSESDDNMEDNSHHIGEDIATSNSSLSSIRENLKSTKNPVLNYSSNAQNLKRHLVVGSNGYDDIDLFFLSMAKTVKKLSRHEQVRLKKNISTLVFEAELKDSAV